MHWISSFVVALAVGAGRLAAAEHAPAPPPDPRKGERYDGRSVAPRTGDHAVGALRAVMTVPRAIVRAVVWPVRATISYVDQHEIDTRVAEALASDDGTRRISPALGYLLSFRPTFGLSLIDRSTLGPGRFYAIDILTGGPSVLELHARVGVTPSLPRVELRLDEVRRDDQLFTGLHGGGAPARYGIDFFDVRALYGVPVGHAARVDFTLGLARHDFYQGGEVAGDSGVEDVYCRRDGRGACVRGSVDPVEMPGFVDGTRYFRSGVVVSFDGRDSPYRPTRGSFLQLRGDATGGTRGGEAIYGHVGASAGTTVRLGDARQVLLFGLRGDAIDHLAGPAVPFSERLTLGGPEDLRGSMPGRYRGMSSLLATAEYRWPVWMWADATLFVDAGAVGDPWWRGIDASAVHADVGFGFRIVTARSFILRAQIAYGGPTDGLQTFIAASPGWYR